MIKGLFFKLHDDKEDEIEVLKFFDEVSKKQKISKIKLLIMCVHCFKFYQEEP